MVVNASPEGGATAALSGEAIPRYRPSQDTQYPSFPMGESQHIHIPSRLSRRQYQSNATSHSYYRAHEEYPTQPTMILPYQQTPSSTITLPYPTQQSQTPLIPTHQYPAAYGSSPGQPFYGPGVAIVRLDELKSEFSEDVDLVLNGNMAVFIRKLDTQKRQLVLELTAVVKKQSDRVIKAIDAGPHDRVVDPVRLRSFSSSCLLLLMK